MNELNEQLDRNGKGTEMTHQDKELINRLKRFATDLGSELVFTAADRIEELVKDLADGSFYKETTIDALIDRAERAEVAEAKLAKAVAALRWYDDPSSQGDVARKVLAEIEGDVK